MSFLWPILQLFRFVIDPIYEVLQHNDFSCRFMAFIPKTVTNIFYGIYLYQILLRLKKSFQGSYLEISKVTYWILCILIISFGVLFPAALLFVNNDSPCIYTWYPSDFMPIKSEDHLLFCSLPLSKNTGPLLFFGVLFTVASNLYFGIVFSVKLSKLLSNQKGNHAVKFNMKALMIKMGILTLTGSVATLICWTLFIFDQFLVKGAFPVVSLALYLDFFVNCAVIGLMFNHNEKHYKRVFKYCILCCFIKCDTSKEKLKEKQVYEYLNIMDNETIMSRVLSTSRTPTADTPRAEHTVDTTHTTHTSALEMTNVERKANPSDVDTSLSENEEEIP